MEEVQMLSRSFYIASPADPIAVLAGELSIPEENCLAYEAQPGDYGFFGRRENSLFFAPVSGSFQFAVDVNLFALDWPALEAKLLAASTRGLLIAVPDETSEFPWDFLLYEAGVRREVQVLEDDAETGEFRILDRLAREGG